MVYRTCIAARIDRVGPELRHLEAVSDFGTDAKIGKRVLGIFGQRAIRRNRGK